jgi:hypothetical protein
MGARGAMAPTNFKKDAFGTHNGTHKILKSPYNGNHVFKFPTHPLYYLTRKSQKIEKKTICISSGGLHQSLLVKQKICK